jgi:hypothetical protein
MATHHSHYLRPQFTDNIIKTLQLGTSINLIASSGQGRKRLLEDLNKMRLENMQILFVDMRNYKENYQGFLKECWQQFGKKGELPTDFPELMTLLFEANKHFVFLFYHFDDLLNNARIDPKFDVHFFNHLNSIKDQENVSLLCVTNCPHDQSIIFINQKIHCYSWLNLEKKRLPKLTYDEIQYELKNRHLPLSMDELSEVAWFVYRNNKPYWILNYFADKLKYRDNEEIELELRLKKWYKQFKKDDFIWTTREVLHSKEPFKMSFKFFLDSTVDFIKNGFSK